VRTLVINPKGTRVAAASFDQHVRVWEMPPSAEPPTQEVAAVPALGIAVSPDGAWLATMGGAGLLLWDAQSGERVKTLHGHQGDLADAAFLPGSKMLVSAGRDGTVRLWDVATGLCRRVFAGGDMLEAVAVSAAGDLVAASGTPDGAVTLWDPATGGRVGVLPGTRPRAAIALAFAPVGDRIAVGGLDGSLRLWRAHAQRLEREFARAGAGFLTLAFMPDGRELLTGDLTGTVKRWSLASGTARLLADLKSPVASLRPFPDGVRTLVTTASGRAYLLTLASGAMTELSALKPTPWGAYGTVSPDGRTVAITNGYAVRLFDTISRQPVWRGLGLFGAPVELLTERGWVRPMPNEVSAPSTVVSWGVGDGERDGLSVADVREFRDGPDGRTLCLWRSGDLLELWSTGSAWRPTLVASAHLPGLAALVADLGACSALVGNEAVRLEASGAVAVLAQPASALAWSSSGLVVAGAGELLQFDSAGRVVERWPSPPLATAVGVFAGLSAFGFADGRVEFAWHGVNDRRQTIVVQEPPHTPIQSIEVAPGGDLVAVGTSDGTVSLYSTEDGRLLARSWLAGEVRFLRFEAHQLVAATELGRYLRWDLALLRSELCAFVTDLTTRVAVVWEQGVPVVRSPSYDGVCRR